MYGWDRLVLLKHLLEEGVPKTVIADRLGVSRRVIYHWIESGQLDRDLAEPPPPRRRVVYARKLDAYKAIVDTRLATFPELSAVRLFEECRAAGYTGSLTQLKVYVRGVRPRPVEEPVIRFETAPGVQVQVDFADVRFPWGKRYAFLAVLGYSRLLYLEFVERQTMDAVVRGLEAAFTYFGGVPQEVLFDQMRAVVVSDARPRGGRLLENPEFLRVAAHWSFRIRACRPYRAQTKGKIERPVSYLRRNFLYGRTFLGDADLASQARAWLGGTANARVHGTTHEVPRLRFERDERPALGPLAVRPYELLVLPTARRPASSRSAPAVPRIAVERRPLVAYTRLASGGQR